VPCPTGRLLATLGGCVSTAQAELLHMIEALIAEGDLNLWPD